MMICSKNERVCDIIMDWYDNRDWEGLKWRLRIELGGWCGGWGNLVMLQGCCGRVMDIEMEW